MQVTVSYTFPLLMVYEVTDTQPIPNIPSGADVDMASEVRSIASSSSSSRERQQKRQGQQDPQEQQPLLSQEALDARLPSIGYRTFHYSSDAPAVTSSRNSNNAQTASGTSTPRYTQTGTRTPTAFSKKIKNANYWTYYVPILSWLPEYSMRKLAGDIAAGLTVSGE